jgi:cytochrome c peroxidase
MNSTWNIWVLLASLWVLSSCSANPLSGGEDGFSAEAWERVLELEPLSVPLGASRFNEHADDPAAATLGQAFFFEKDFSTAVRVAGPSGGVGEVRTVACATCHEPDAYFSDPRRTGGVSHGVDFTARNAPSLVNVAYYYWFDWGGRADTLAAQGVAALETMSDGGSSRLLVAHLVWSKYRETYESIFGPLDPALDAAAADAARFPLTGGPKASASAADGPWEMMREEDRRVVDQILANVGKALEAYERRLISGASPFGRYIGDVATADFSEAARRGLALFVGKAACNECHRGPILSDNQFHNVGVPQAVGDNTPAVDEGRYEDVAGLLADPFNSAGPFSADPAAGAARLAGIDPGDETTRGQFRTKSLLDVSETGPYFHNGSARTLREVVQHYDAGGGDVGTFSGQLDPKIRPLGLSGAEVDDLVAFLRSLTGEPVAPEWRSAPAE